MPEADFVLELYFIRKRTNSNLASISICGSYLVSYSSTDRQPDMMSDRTNLVALFVAITTLAALAIAWYIWGRDTIEPWLE